MLNGQSYTPSTKLASLTKFDIGLQGVGITHEQKSSTNVTIDISAGGGGGYDISEGYISYNLKLQKPAFYFLLNPKYYYNQNSRITRGKNTIFNSGNYLGARIKYVSPNDAQLELTRNSILVNIHWGLQRAISSKWTINTHVGVGYAQDIDNNFGTPYPAIDFKFSYIFTKNNNER